MPALHVLLGTQTAKKLDEICQVTEESKTSLVARLIREEWDRQREKVPPIYITGMDPAASATEIAERVAMEARRRNLSTSPEDAVRRRKAAAFDGINRSQIFATSSTEIDGQSDRVV